MKRLSMLGLVAALCACPSEPSTPPLPSMSPSLASPAPTAASSTLTVQVAGVTGVPDATPAATPEPDPEPAKACAPWMGQPRCILGDHVLASAKAPGIKDASLARTTAGNRARAALVGGNGSAAGAEIVRVEPCGHATWALARASLADISAEKLPACDASAFADAVAH